MKIQQTFLAGFIALIPMICSAQIPDYFPVIDSNDFRDAEFTKAKTYTGASLFGYMDGGAELYLEYGFSGAMVSEMQWKGNRNKIEIYRMTSPESAFGIFTVSRFRCNSTPPLAAYTCQTPYQLQFCSGVFYVSISNSGGLKADSASLCAIGRAVSGKIHESSFNLTDYFPGIDGIDESDAIMIKGDAGLANGAPDMADFFSGFSGYSAIILQQGENKFVSIKFNDAEQLNQFILKHQWHAENLKEGSLTDAGPVNLTLLSSVHLLIGFKK